jgi:superfamily II DNA or RNA helicase
MSEVIKLTKLNESFISVDCSSAVENELSQFLTFKAPGAEYIKRYRGGRRWDGYIRLFDRRKRQVYVGLLPYLKQFASDRQYELSFDKSGLESYQKISMSGAKKFIEDCNIHSGGKPIEIRDYQLHSFIYGIALRRMLLESPTSSGKSAIQYLLFRYLTEVLGYKKGLLIVPTVNLVNQMHSDFKDYSSKNGYDVESNCHQIHEGRSHDASDKKLYISTWQSIYENPQTYFEQFDFILGDEAHLSLQTL